jgi:hypothetical protein
MRHLLKRPSPAMIVACLSLFVALSGVTYAATGGNFLLGRPNSATSQTALSAPIANKALQVTNTSTAAGASGIGITVGTNKAPLAVNATAGKATNLNSDKLDGLDSTAFLRTTGKAADSNMLDGLDSGTFGRLIALRTDGLVDTIVAGDNFLLVSPFTPDVSGRCEVTVTAQVGGSGANTTLGPYFRVAIKKGAAAPVNDGFYGHYFQPSGDYSSDMTRTMSIDVTAGEPTQFGAFLGNPDTNWQGDSLFAHVTYLCTTIGTLPGAQAAALKGTTSSQGQ